jgi:hypothetical protein
MQRIMRNLIGFFSMLCLMVGLPHPESGNASGASYGSLERRPRTVQHDGKTYYQPGSLLRYDQQRSRQEALEQGGGAPFYTAYTNSGSSVIFIWKPRPTQSLPSDSWREPYLLPPWVRPVRVDPQGTPPAKLTKLPIAVNRPGSKTASPYLVRPQRPDLPAVTVTRPAPRPPRGAVSRPPVAGMRPRIGVHKP